MGPITKYYRLMAAQWAGAVVLVVATLATPDSYILIPIAVLVLWFGIITLKLSDICCRCGWRLDNAMSWVKGWPKRECPACGRDLTKP